MNVFVLGGSGFVGRRVVGLLAMRGHQVHGVARSSGAADVLRQAGARVTEGDLDDPEPVRRAMEAVAPDAVLVLVPFTAGHGPRTTELIERAGIHRAVFVSTTAIFTTLDTGTKPVRMAAEDSIRNSALAWTILRPTMIYGGPDDRNLSRIIRFVRRCPVVPLPDGGRGLQQPVHVDDVAAAIVRALESTEAIGKTYQLAGPEAISLRQLVDDIVAALGKPVLRVPVPVRPLAAAAKAYERVARRPRFRAEHLARLVEDKSFDITEARMDLGFEPRSFRVGIRQETELLSDTAGGT